MKRWRIGYLLILALLAWLALSGCNDDNTTGPNEPPPTPSDPVPANGALDQDLRVRLEWQSFDPDGDAVSYDLYLGTTNPPLYDTTVSTFLYSHDRLEFNTTYYWQIVANDNHNPDVTGPIWSFATGNIYQVDAFDTQNALKIYVNDDSLVFLADDNAGMKIFMVTDTSQVGARIDSVGAIASGGFNNDVYAQGNYAYMATGTGLAIFDITNPGLPSRIPDSLWSTPPFEEGEDVRAVNVIGDYAYTTSVFSDTLSDDDTSLVKIIDVSDVTNVIVEGEYTFAGIAQDIYVFGDYAYVADSLNGLRIFNISDETNPTLESTLITNDRTIAVFVVGTTVFVADGSAGLTVVDATNASAPSIIGNVSMPDYARDVYVRGDYAYVADYAHGGLQIADISVPSAPVIVGSRMTLGGAAGVFANEHYIYFADKFNGLIVYEFQP